jgi:putative lipoprotein
MSQPLIGRFAVANSLTCLFLFLLAASAAQAQVAYVQQSLQPSNRWQLGVKVQNTNTGVVLTYVQPGSVAANAGLSVGDRILAIGGHQVGYVDGQLIDPVDEINQHIDPAGQVTMLVMTGSRGLLAGSLSLATSSGVLQGLASIDGRVSGSPQSVLNVRLLDVTNNWNGVVVGQTSLPRPSANPCYFQLQYNANQIYPGHRYAIAAELIDRGQTIYRTPQPTPIALDAGQVAITLVAAGRDNVTAMPSQQINGWYQTYLGRLPTQQEASAWADQLNRGQPVTSVQAYLLGSSEFYDRSQNNPDVYLRDVYRALYGSDPTPQQLAVLRQQYNQTGVVRTQFVQQLQATAR